MTRTISGAELLSAYQDEKAANAECKKRNAEEEDSFTYHVTEIKLIQ